jgi:hypothetical protein
MGKQEKASSYIYAIKAVGTSRYKIGTTTDLKGRLATVQTGCPYPAQIVATWDGDRRLETAIHRELAEYRRVGEWFEIEEEWVIGWKVWRVKAGLSEHGIEPETKDVKACRTEKKKHQGAKRLGPKTAFKALGPRILPIHEIDIVGWSPVASGKGKAIRFKLGSPAPDTGAMTRYYTWIPNEVYPSWKKQFKVQAAINASRNKPKIIEGARRYLRQLSENRLILPLPSAQSLDLRG